MRWLAYFCSFFSIFSLFGGGTLDRFDRYAERTMGDWGVPGVVVGVVKGGAVVFTGEYGEKELSSEEKVDFFTQFPLGTLSATLVTQGLLAMNEDGLLSLNDPVIKYLPRFFEGREEYRKELSLKDLVLHRTGIPHRTGDRLWKGAAGDVMQRISYLEPTHGLRYRFDYQSVMMLPISNVMESVSKMGWENYLQERLFSRVGMVSTGTALSEGRALGHRVRDGVSERVSEGSVSNCAPGVGLRSSGVELCMWLSMLLQGGEGAKGEVFKKESIDQLFTPAVPIGKVEDSLDANLFNGYGLGFVMQDYQGVSLYWHNGIAEGHHCFVALFPERDLGVVVLTNEGSNRLAEALGLRIADIYLGHPTRDWSRHFMKRAQPLAFEKKRGERLS